MESAIFRFVEVLFKGGHLRVAVGLVLLVLALWAMGKTGVFLAGLLREFMAIQKQKESALMVSLNNAFEFSRGNETRLMELLDRNTKATESISVHMTEQTNILANLKYGNESDHRGFESDLARIAGWIGKS